jgi:endonuclease/exonuclease/phosphatase family metal-dependent hydrolase
VGNINKKKKLLFLGKSILFINWIAVVCLLISYISHFISPEKIYILAFFGIAFPYFIVVNLIFIIYWLLRLRWQFIFSLIAIIISWNTLNKFININLNKEQEASKHSFKVLSYNVRVFDIYNYDKHWVSNTGKRNAIFSYITKEQPDIICFQEFVDDKGGKFKVIDTLPYFQKAKNYHFEYTKNVRNMNYFGIATFSSFPIVNKGKILFGEKTGNICIYTDVKINDKIIRIFNIHFQSIRFREEDYEFAERIREMEDVNKDDEFKPESKKIFKQLRRAFIRRAQQVDLVEQYIKSSPYPVIICGDFNDTPSSYAYYTISDKLSDAFCESGNGFGQTYAGGAFPSFRIDYIIHSNSLKGFNFDWDKITYSDHYPIHCEIEY